MKVSPKTLERCAGSVWYAIGLLLAYRGTRMVLGDDPTPVALVLAFGIALAIGWLKGTYVLSRTARRNCRRIAGLDDPRIWNVFTARFVVLIGGMIALGKGLRTAAEHDWLGGFTGVGAVYVGIGVALVASARAYFARPAPPLETRSESPPVTRERPTGVLVVNLGTPDAPTTPAVRRYLRQFLSDPRVVEVNRAVWAFVLNVIILPRRAGASAEAYRQVWTEEGSPLLFHTRRAAEALAVRLGDGYRLVCGMRYGNPDFASAVDELRAAGCERVVALPLFPQFSDATSGSIQAELARVLGRRRDAPALSVVPPFYDHPGYLDAAADRIREALEGRSVDFHVLSFHGLPEAYVRRGDPYLDQCTRTAWGIAERLGLRREQWEMVFQSRFGDEPWLQPYADEFVPALAARHPRVLVATPGFAADCLETIEEIGIRLRDDFLRAGGEELVVAPALNADPAWVETLAELVRRA